MIKDGAYIRKFTPEQIKQLEAIADEHGIASAKNVLLFALEKYKEHEEEIARLKRFLVLKQSKIEALTSNP